MRKTPSVALCLALLFSVFVFFGCASPMARQQGPIHHQYTEASVQHELTMDCLWAWDKGAKTSYNMAETDKASGRLTAKPSDFLLLPFHALDNCMWGGSKKGYRQ